MFIESECIYLQIEMTNVKLKKVISKVGKEIMWDRNVAE